MPITRSAKKALRSSRRKRVRNFAQKKTLLSAVKKMRKLIAAREKKESAEFFPQIQKMLDKGVKYGLLKANAAARKKSRFAAMIKKIA